MCERREGRRGEKKRRGNPIPLLSNWCESVTFTMMNEGEKGKGYEGKGGNEKQQASMHVWARTRATGVDVGSHTTNKTKKEKLIKNTSKQRAAATAATHKYSEGVATTNKQQR